MADPFYIEISRRLVQARRAHGRFSQRAAAAALGVSQSTYAQYENEDFGVPVHALARCADLYDVSVEWLVTGNSASKREGKSPVHQGVILSAEDCEALIEPVALLLQYARLSPVQRKSMRNLKSQIEKLGANTEAESDSSSEGL